MNHNVYPSEKKEKAAISEQYYVHDSGVYCRTAIGLHYFCISIPHKLATECRAVTAQ